MGNGQVGCIAFTKSLLQNILNGPKTRSHIKLISRITWNVSLNFIFMISRLSHSFKNCVTNLFVSGKKYIYKRKYFSFISGCYKWIAYIPYHHETGIIYILLLQQIYSICIWAISTFSQKNSSLWEKAIHEAIGDKCGLATINKTLHFIHSLILF